MHGASFYSSPNFFLVYIHVCMCTIHFIFRFLQISEDIDDLETAFSMKKSEKSPILNSNAGSCSALIKVLPSNSDLYTAHDTWADYHSMLRMIKLYDLPYHTSPDSGNRE